MIIVTATDLKNKLGQIINQAQREPVLVQSHGRDVVVIVDHQEFARLRRLEDAHWAARAEEALKSGFLSPEQSMAFLLACYESAEDA